MDWPLIQVDRWKSMLCIVLLLSLAISINTSCSAQYFKLDGNRKKDAIDFIRVKNLIVIPLYINNNGPYNFLLDTGVGQMIITDTSFLKILNVKQFKTYKIQGYGLGTEIDAILTRNITARVGNSEIKNIPTAIFKEDIFDLSSYLGIKIHGILGYFFFQSFAVRINYLANKITYFRPDANRKIKGVKVPIEIINAKPYLKAEVSIDSTTKTRLNLLVDNGSSHALLLESINEQAFPLPKNTIPANLGVGINGEITGAMGRLHSLTISDFTFNNILAGFPVYDVQRTDLEGTPRNGSLGAEVLKHFVVTFDYQNGAMYLKKSNAFKRKFEHDMSGIEIYVLKEPNDRYYISRVEPGSPAESIGLTAGDEILSVDFKSIDHFNLNELSELFRDRDGKQMLIEVLHEKERRIVILRLKRRI